jgi:uncharacterized protein
MAGLAVALTPIKQMPRQLLLLAVKFYRYFFKAWLGNACRFEPSCSQYALDALERHGASIGASLATARILRCHPWCEGGCDPVPHEPPAIFSRLGLVSDRSELRP